MQRITLLLLTLCSFTFLQAQPPVKKNDKNIDGITKCVNYYLEGGTNNDFEMLEKAFHPNATMKYISDGEYKEVNAVNFFKERMKPGPKQNRSTSIQSIDVQGHAANAKLKIQYPDFYFIDYMNLLKIDGEWKIVSKIFYRGE